MIQAMMKFFFIMQDADGLAIYCRRCYPWQVRVADHSAVSDIISVAMDHQSGVHR